MSHKKIEQSKIYDPVWRDWMFDHHERELSRVFNLPHLYLAHDVRDNEFNTPSLYVHVVDLSGADEKVPYEVFFEVYEHMRSLYQQDINVYVKAVDNKDWSVPKIK